MDPQRIEGTVAKLVYRNPDNGYSVVRIEERSGLLTTAVGTLPEVSPGVDLVLWGHWTTHARYGKQFQIADHEIVAPRTEEGIEAYLGSGLIENVGPASAHLIVARFGRDTLRVLDEEPERLQEVRGIGKGRADAIAQSWQEHRSLSRLMMALHGYGISTTMAVRAHREFGSDALAVLQQDPYRLTEISGIGFKRADFVARAMGIALDTPARVDAGLIYVLQEAAADGHTYLPWSELKAQALDTLGQAVAPHLEEAAHSLRERHKIETDGSKVYLSSLWDAETDVANLVRSLMNTPSSIEGANEVTPQANGVELSREQYDAVVSAIGNKVTVLTGGPGTGKTVTTKAVVHTLERLRCRYALCAPTGRAAKRLAETTERSARTIHRLLEYNPEVGFHHDVMNPLDADFIVVDEASMLDIQLAAHLLRALKPSTQVLFVGDVNQLPSVGAGNVLHDLIASDRVNVAHLTRIFRQAAGSGIVVNAHRVNRGQSPICNDGYGDFFLFTEEDPQEAARLLVDVVTNRIPRTFGLSPHDVQVLAPMHRGECGIANLNVQLQTALNAPSPHKAELSKGKRVFREGDRVMQTRNNYDQEVFNGDVGRVTRIDVDERKLIVRIDDVYVEYNWPEADELVHAYAMSVHKSQGSEYPAVVMPVVTQHYVMLQRNLLYTAITRARSLVVLVGTRQALGIAVKNDRVCRRYSGLRERL
ncbi:MAG: ATP-dependent RecD-like DNA helicase [Anaerolineae bacterium]|nr:ATP-dependent RecD-like DNA helicase [Anaerolineae bacterium]